MPFMGKNSIVWNKWVQNLLNGFCPKVNGLVRLDFNSFTTMLQSSTLATTQLLNFVFYVYMKVLVSNLKDNDITN